jgi:DNA-binding transcriptional MerR regulator
VAAASTEPTTANPDELLRRIEEVWRSRLEFLISGLKVIAGSSTKTGSRKHQLRKYREYKKSLAEWMAELTTGQLAGVQIAATSILSHRHILAVFEVQADSLAAAAGVIKTATRARGPYTRLPGRGYVWFASRKRAVSERANDPVDAPLLLSDAIRAARNDDSFLDDFLKEAIGKPATVRNLGMLARVLAQPGAGTDAKLQEIARDGDPIGALVRQIAILSSPGGAVRLKAIKGRAEKLRNLVPVLGQRRIHLSKLACTESPDRPGLMRCIPSWQFEWIKRRGGEYQTPEEFNICKTVFADEAWRREFDDSALRECSNIGLRSRESDRDCNVLEYDCLQRQGLTTEEIGKALSWSEQTVTSVERSWKRRRERDTEQREWEADVDQQNVEASDSDLAEHLVDQGVNRAAGRAHEGKFLYEDARHFRAQINSNTWEFEPADLLNAAAQYTKDLDIVALLQQYFIEYKTAKETIASLGWTLDRFDRTRVAWGRARNEVFRRVPLYNSHKTTGMSSDRTRQNTFTSFHCNASHTWKEDLLFDEIDESGKLTLYGRKGARKPHTFSHRAAEPLSNTPVCALCRYPAELARRVPLLLGEHVCRRPSEVILGRKPNLEEAPSTFPVGWFEPPRPVEDANGPTIRGKCELIWTKDELIALYYRVWGPDWAPALIAKAPSWLKAGTKRVPVVSAGWQVQDGGDQPVSL